MKFRAFDFLASKRLKSFFIKGPASSYFSPKMNQKSYLSIDNSSTLVNAMTLKQDRK